MLLLWQRQQRQRPQQLQQPQVYSHTLFWRTMNHFSDLFSGKFEVEAQQHKGRHQRERFACV